jgi:hypothetical protein
MSMQDDQAARRFDRERRRHVVARIAARLRQEPDDVHELLRFDDVIGALGRRSQTDLGVRTIPLDSIVGTVGRPREFDRSFRPTRRRVRPRWLRVASARRDGREPPIRVYRVNTLHFVEDGHHRVSVARAMGAASIDAYVTDVATTLPLTPELLSGELSLKHHERLFHQRVPLPPAARRRIRLTDEWRYAQLAALIEALGYRESRLEGRVLSREELARRWFQDRYEPTVEMLNEADLGGPGTETDRYLRLMMLRYLLLHTHEWSDEVVERLCGVLRGPPSDDDTLVHQLLDEMRQG